MIPMIIRKTEADAEHRDRLRLMLRNLIVELGYLETYKERQIACWRGEQFDITPLLNASWHLDEVIRYVESELG